MNVYSFSPYIITIVAAWIIAHTIKFIICSIKKEKYKRFRSYLFMSGGMPSAHSATTMALATLIGLKEGFSSGLFGVAILFSIITMYDAVKVRRTVGEQGVAIEKLIKETKNENNIKLPRVSKGHTPLEVAFGAILGILIGWVVFLATTNM